MDPPQKRSTRVVYAVLGFTMAIAAAITIVAIFVSDSNDETALRLGYSGATFLLTGLTAVAGASLIGGSGLRWLGAICVLASIGAFVTLTVLYWTTGIMDDSPDMNLVKTGGSLFVASLGLAHASLALSWRRTTDGRLVSAAVGLNVISIAALSGLFLAAIVREVGDDLFWRYVGAVAVVWALCTALVPILRRMRLAA
jgi:hypothetical protein